MKEAVTFRRAPCQMFFYQLKQAVTFRRAPCQMFFNQLKVSKNEMVKQIALSTNGSYQLAFLEEVLLNHSTKGAMTGSFRRAPCSLPYISKKSATIKCLSKLLQLQIKFISKTFAK